MAVDHEVIIEFSKLANEHTAYLSKIVGALVVVEIFMIAHTLHAMRLRFSQSRVGIFLFCAALANVLSLACGYFSDAGTLFALETYASGGTWQPSHAAELLNLFQMIFLLIGLAIFLAAFFFYSRILAAVLIRAGSHGGGGEDG